MTAGRARAALALICAASVLTLVLLGTRLTFFNDDWAFLLQRPGLTAATLLDDHNGHLSVLPVLIYKLLVGLFGLDAQLPFRLLLGLAVAAVGAVVYALVSERAGRVAGLVAAALLMFLGPAWEDLLWSFQIGFVGSLATGLGALLALERDTPRRNAAACALLVVSVGLSDVGIALIVAAAIAVALRRRPAQAWIPGVALALFVLWFVTYGRDAPSGISGSNLLDVPRYVLDSAAAGIASLTGFGPGGWFGATTVSGRALLALALLAAVLWFLRGGRPSARLLVFLGGALAFWCLAGANFTPGREPAASRYQLVHATVLVLIAAELVGPLRLGRAWSAIALAIALVAFGSNLSALGSGYDFMREHAANARAALGALDLARASAPAGLRLDVAVAGDPFLRSVTAGRYYAERDRHGSPAWSPGAIAAAPAAARRVADGVLVAADRPRLARVPFRRPRQGAPVQTMGAGCRALTTGDTTLPPAGATVTNPGAAAVTLGLRRFAAAGAPTPLGVLPGRAAARIDLPADAATAPWHLVAAGAPRLQLCGP
jgi:hypothetical protein